MRVCVCVCVCVCTHMCLEGRPASQRFREELMLQLKSKHSLEAKFLPSGAPQSFISSDLQLIL